MSEKKNIALLVLETLKKHSSVEHPLTKSELCRLLEKNYQVVCDRRTVASAIDSLCALGYKINFQTVNKKKSSIYLEPILSENSAEILNIALATSDYIDCKSADEITERLSFHGALFPRLSVYKNGVNIKEFFENLKKLKSAISAKQQITFSILPSFINNKRQFIKEKNQVKVFLVNPLEIFFTYGRAILFCEVGDTKIYRYFRIEQLYDIKQTGSSFEFVEEICSPRPSCKIEADTLCFSERARAVVRVNDCYLAEFAASLGNDCEILSKYAEKTELAVYCDLRALKRLILTFGANAEALSPTKLRRAVALELQATSAKYLEIRRLHGTM